MKTSKADFQLFKDECEYWFSYLPLQGWKRFYVHKKLDGSYAECSADIEGRVATLFLNSEFKDEIVTKEQVKVSAFHEVCEVFLARIDMIATSRWVTARDIREEIRNIIRTLENTFFKELER